MLLIVCYHGNLKEHLMKVLSHPQHPITALIQNQVIMVLKQGYNLQEVV